MFFYAVLEVFIGFLGAVFLASTLVQTALLDVVGALAACLFAVLRLDWSVVATILVDAVLIRFEGAHDAGFTAIRSTLAIHFHRNFAAFALAFFWPARSQIARIGRGAFAGIGIAASHAGLEGLASAISAIFAAGGFAAIHHALCIFSAANLTSIGFGRWIYFLRKEAGVCGRA